MAAADAVNAEVANTAEADRRVQKWVDDGDDDVALHLSELGLGKLPILPNKLQILYCADNQLTELPQRLPDGLRALYCSNNSLTELPRRLPDKLQVLCCEYNLLTELPILPSDLHELWCRNNQLAVLPYSLNNLQILMCVNNQLTELPIFSTALAYADCKGNAGLIAPPYDIAKNNNITAIRKWQAENPIVSTKSAHKR